jgi:hypothetical protein
MKHISACDVRVGPATTQHSLLVVNPGTLLSMRAAVKLLSGRSSVPFLRCPFVPFPHPARVAKQTLDSPPRSCLACLMNTYVFSTPTATRSRLNSLPRVPPASTPNARRRGESEGVVHPTRVATGTQQAGRRQH